MITLTKNNYIQAYGCGNNFNVLINSIPNKFDNYYKESVFAAEEIYSMKQGNLNILYSGGVDSEYALSIFLKSGIPIHPVIIKLNPNYNAHDTDYAIKFCEDKNIKFTVIDIDFDNFVTSGLMLNIAKEINCSIYHRSATAYAAQQLDGTVLLGDGEPYIKLKDDGVWNIEIYQHDYAVANYFKKHGIYGTPHFNRYSPEMMAAFLSDHRMIDLANNRVPGKLSSNSSKFIIYNRNGNLNIEERPKYHGYEKIETSKIFQDPSFNEIAVLSKSCDGIYSTNYFDFMKENNLC